MILKCETINWRGMLLPILISILHSSPVYSQYCLQHTINSLHYSIHKEVSFANVKKREITLNQILTDKSISFQKVNKEILDFGFSSDNIWFRFQLKNISNVPISYFFETARPITDIVQLYSIDSNGIVTKSFSGDAIPVNDRDFNHRSTIFRMDLNPLETKSYYLHVKSDGEQLSMPFILHSTENLLEQSSFEQFIFGLFYGLLVLAFILYLFFYFAIRDRTFLYYSMYVVFIGLLQFSVDGYFYKLITPQSGWLSLHSVLIFACLANFFLGRYAQVFLKIQDYNRTINKSFYILYGLDFTLLLFIIISPKALVPSYPIANLLGLILLVLIITTQIIIYRKTKKIDRFFAIGIFFLISGFVVFILKNFSVLPLTFWTENGSKLGTGLEVIFLSLSMANLIRNLKNEREELQTIALEKSEEMNELKSYFLSNISHELRTPLNAIMSLSEVTAIETDIVSVKSNCDIIKHSSISLLNSVNDILDFSKIEKGELKLESAPFNPINLINQLKNIVEISAQDKGLQIDFNIDNSIPNSVIGDASRFSQMATNIINNAIKFTAEGNISIQVNCTKIVKNQCTLQLLVQDTGIGIPKDKLKRIYDSFMQDSINNTRKFGGLGLGLFIVKKLVDLHKGTIDIQSDFGKGTLCTLTLTYEIHIDESMATPIGIVLDYDLKGTRILVIEDNAMNQMVIKMITKKWENTIVDYANNGEEGVQKLQSQNYDIILMDLQMPIMDGYEATIAIRNGEAGMTNSTIPIIAVTADVMESTKKRVFEIGMNHYLSKPINKDQLFEAIKLLIFEN
jgi:signal transduction histidine kinase